jgi:hypothetical protein
LKVLHWINFTLDSGVIEIHELVPGEPCKADFDIYRSTFSRANHDTNHNTLAGRCTQLTKQIIGKQLFIVARYAPLERGRERLDDGVCLRHPSMTLGRLEHTYFAHSSVRLTNMYFDARASTPVSRLTRIFCCSNRIHRVPRIVSPSSAI